MEISAIFPAALLYSLPSFRAHTAGFAPPRWLMHYALDVTRAADGTWRVVRDLTDAPSGLGYSLLNRAVLARLLAHNAAADHHAPAGGAGDEQVQAVLVDLRHLVFDLGHGDLRAAGVGTIEHWVLAWRRMQSFQS